MTRREQAMYCSALEYATQKHSGQFRIGGAPYITHPVAVAQLVRESGYGPNYQIAALFHDLLEDTDATQAEIAALSNDEVLAAVVLLTKEKGYDMQEYIGNICKNPMAKAVKAADRLHNLQCAMDTTQEFKCRYILETVDWYMDFEKKIPKAVRVLAQSLEQPMTDLSFLYEPAKNKITLDNCVGEESTMENALTVERAMQAPSVDALFALVRGNGILLPMENVQELYEALHTKLGVLSDKAMDTVSGGGEISAPKACPRCHATPIGIALRGEWVYECLDTQCAFAWKI